MPSLSPTTPDNMSATTKLPPKMNLIAAVCAPNNGIGKNGTLPWRLKLDFAIFVKLTTETKDVNKKNAVVMGRKCWESIPKKFRPLRNRVNFVLSRTLSETSAGCADNNVFVCRSMEEVYERIKTLDLPIETVWNIGGRDIYSLGLQSPHLHRVYLTKIQQNFDCDVHFPTIDWQNFLEIQDELLPQGECDENDLTFTFHAYERKVE